MTTLRDILNNYNHSVEIMYLVENPYLGEEDSLYGYCFYDHETDEIIARDGDYYSMNDIVKAWKYDEYSSVLKIWVAGRWEGDTYVAPITQMGVSQEHPLDSKS